MEYNFRGIVVFIYNPETKTMNVPDDEDNGIINNFNFCKFIPEDYKLMAEFFNTVHRHAIGEITDDELEDINVN